MNVRIIDPGKAATSRRFSWRSEVDVGELLDEDEPGPLAPPERDDRFELLLDLKNLALAYLKEAEAADPEVLPQVLAEFFKKQAGAVEAAICALSKTGDEVGLILSPSPRVDLRSGFSALAREAVVEVFDPFSSEAELITGALVVNSLGVAVISAFLCESDACVWRPVLLPILVEDCRFEGRLTATLSGLGEEAEERAAELLALTSGSSSANGGYGDRLWSFDLLRMAVSRLACGGSRERRGGFFPDGMSGFGGD